MSCKLPKCHCDSFTKDGYCNKHRYWSNETPYISEHTTMYLNKIAKAKTHNNKQKYAIRLFNYLQYKPIYFEDKAKFKETVLKKMTELKQVEINDPDLKQKLFKSMEKLESIL